MHARTLMGRFSKSGVVFLAIGVLLGVLPPPHPARGADRTPEGQFWAAASKGDLSQLDQLLNQGVKVDAADKIGRTALIFAAINGRVEAMKFLMDKGANVGWRIKSGFTVLMLSAIDGQAEAVKLLLSRGADVNATMPFTYYGTPVADWVTDALCFASIPPRPAQMSPEYIALSDTFPTFRNTKGGYKYPETVGSLLYAGADPNKSRCFRDYGMDKTFARTIAVLPVQDDRPAEDRKKAEHLPDEFGEDMAKSLRMQKYKVPVGTADPDSACRTLGADATLETRLFGSYSGKVVLKTSEVSFVDVLLILKDCSSHRVLWKNQEVIGANTGFLGVKIVNRSRMITDMIAGSIRYK